MSGEEGGTDFAYPSLDLIVHGTDAGTLGRLHAFSSAVVYNLLIVLSYTCVVDSRKKMFMSYD